MFDAPIDLSGLPNYHALKADRPSRTAFLGRCSTKDNQDPRSSIAGQVAEACTLLQPGEKFIGCYWDVESGMLGLAERGQLTDAHYATLGVSVPRDGGLPELLERVERGEIDRVVTERISRVARDMLTSLEVEAHLKRRGVALEAANEPRSGGMTSGHLQLRRTSQVTAEVVRAELMEMSMRGQRQHAANGYQHGPPCYGYISVVDPDAPPAANRFGGGRPKRRLQLHADPRRATTVQEVFQLRRERELSDGAIARILCRDRELYPLAEGQQPWSARRICRMLCQPKYTGYQVFDRCAARTHAGRLNPVSQWVWSRELAHPVIVPLEEWHETQIVTARMRQDRLSGLARIRAAARDCGLTVQEVRRSDTHVLYSVGDQTVVLEAGKIPTAVVSAVIAQIVGKTA